MTRVALYLVGSVVVLTLTGCGRGFVGVQERDPWRREAEAACLQSGAVKQNNLIAQIKAINGPGVCGADYPFKVSALGETSALGFAEDMRPPGAIPTRFPIPDSPRNAPYPARYTDPAPAPAAASGPMSIRPPGTDADDEEDVIAPDEGAGAQAPEEPRAQSYPPPSRYPAQQQYQSPRNFSERPESAPPSLGRGHAPMSTASSMAMISPPATLACPLIAALDHWMAASVQPAAQRWFGQPVVEIKQISAYSCRGMNGQRGAPISEHAFGNALDIAAFVLADGRKISVQHGWRGLPEEQGFLHDVQAAACDQFSTVLAPGSNVYHYNHIHVDLARRRSGRAICKPHAIPGDVVAQRARDRFPGFGSGRMGFAAEPESKSPIDVKLPLAIPGED
jgi:hypothetical protein